MFKKILTTLLACFMVVAVKAEGIRFDKKLSWAAIKEKARKENKYIFMDCQTTWCGWDAVLGKNAASNKQKKVITHEIRKVMSKNIHLSIDSLKTVYRTRYPGINMEQSIDDLQLDAALSSDLPNSKDLYLQLAKNYVSKYGSDISPDMWAVLSWNVSSSSTDEARLRLALDWCKKGMEKSDGKNTSLIDCYSRILYKLGEKQEAIKWAEKLVSLLPENDREQSQAMLEKMKKGV